MQINELTICGAHPASRFEKSIPARASNVISDAIPDSVLSLKLVGKSWAARCVDTMAGVDTFST
jgi:hypothetical protein